MDGASLQFIAFGLAAALLSNFSNSRIWRGAVLMVFSFGFLGLLAVHTPTTLLPFVGFLLIGYIGLAVVQFSVSRFKAEVLLIIIFVYMWLKKYTFLPEGAFLHHPYFTLGLSYIFFRVLHLLIESSDVANGRRIGIGYYLLYLLNFTTLVSGPIQRYEDFARDQFAAEPLGLGPDVIGTQLEGILRGFFKVNVLGFVLGALQEGALTQVSQAQLPSQRVYAAFLLGVCYPFLLYANFSGYIDIVIALARLMRLRLPENFNRPFAATSFIDFWNRWHITLSTWLKTYVYNPLLVALMRRFPSTTFEPVFGVVSFFVTFFLIGVWHGRTTEFIVFGILQGGGVSINKLWQLGLRRALGRCKYKTVGESFVYTMASRGLTFSWFAFTLFWFWAKWEQIWRISSAMGFLQWLYVWIAIWLCASLVLAVWEWLRGVLLSIRSSTGPLLMSRYAHVVYASAFALGDFVVAVLLNQPTPDIVYKGF